MLPKARIGAVATAFPPYVLDQNEVVERSREMFAPDVPGFERFTDAYRNAAIETRHSCVPIEWYSQKHPFSERNDLFIENAVEAHMLTDRGHRLHRARAAAHAGKKLGNVVQLAGLENVVVNANLILREIFPGHIRHLGIFLVLAHWIVSPSCCIR